MYKLAKNPDGTQVKSVQKQVSNVLYSIPFDPANRDYTEYLEWLSLGNTPIPADEPTLPE